MSDSLQQFLDDQDADAAVLQHAVRYLVAELSDDRSPEDMLDELHARAGDAARVDELLALLRTDGAALLEVNRAMLEAAWADPETRELVRSAVVDAKAKLPVVEVGLIAIAAMYGLSMYMTKGKAREIVVVREADGSEQTTITEYQQPASAMGVVARVLDLLGRGGS